MDVSLLLTPLIEIQELHLKVLRYVHLDPTILFSSFSYDSFSHVRAAKSRKKKRYLSPLGRVTRELFEAGQSLTWVNSSEQG